MAPEPRPPPGVGGPNAGLGAGRARRFVVAAASPGAIERSFGRSGATPAAASPEGLGGSLGGSGSGSLVPAPPSSGARWPAGGRPRPGALRVSSGAPSVEVPLSAKGRSIAQAVILGDSSLSPLSPGLSRSLNRTRGGGGTCHHVRRAPPSDMTRPRVGGGGGGDRLSSLRESLREAEDVDASASLARSLRPSSRGASGARPPPPPTSCLFTFGITCVWACPSASLVRACAGDYGATALVTAPTSAAEAREMLSSASARLAEAAAAARGYNSTPTAADAAVAAALSDARSALSALVRRRRGRPQGYAFPIAAAAAAAADRDMHSPITAAAAADRDMHSPITAAAAAAATAAAAARIVAVRRVRGLMRVNAWFDGLVVRGLIV